MKLKFCWHPMRGNHLSPIEVKSDVVDEDTDKVVGYLIEKTPPIERTISLFGGKYVGVFKKQEECAAFARGVEAVLNHLTSTDHPREETPVQ